MTASASPAPVLLIIHDGNETLDACRRLFRDPDLRLLAAASAEYGLDLARQHRPTAVLLDLDLPDAPGLGLFRTLHELDPLVPGEPGLGLFRTLHDLDPLMPVVVLTAQGGMRTAIEAVKGGALDCLVEPVTPQRLRRAIEFALRVGKSMRSAHLPPREDPSEGSDETIIGRCAAMHEVFMSVARVAPQDVNVLVIGESGTGKELVAKAIYEHSRRVGRPFLAVNCAAIPETLLESELFGHEKGAFTGADRQRLGKFEQCRGGTLMLDEIGDMTPLTQAKVLRVLQDQTFERVGGHETVRTDVRLIAATNKDLEKEVAEGRFRADLYYRLSVFGIFLPPLRERGEDLPLLVDHFVARFGPELGKSATRVSAEALEVLMRYDWPGNVRELQSVLKQALLRNHGPLLLPEFLPASLPRSPAPVSDAEQAPAPVFDRLAAYIEERLDGGAAELHREVHTHVDRLLLGRVMEVTEGNQLRAARILGIARGKLRARLRVLGLHPRLPDKGEGAPP